MENVVIATLKHMNSLKLRLPHLGYHERGIRFFFSKEFKPVAYGNNCKTDKYGSDSTNQCHN